MRIFWVIFVIRILSKLSIVFSSHSITILQSASLFLLVIWYFILVLISSISSSDVNKNKGVAETAPSYRCALSTTLLGTSWLLTLMNALPIYRNELLLFAIVTTTTTTTTKQKRKRKRRQKQKNQQFEGKEGFLPGRVRMHEFLKRRNITTVRLHKKLH